MNCSDALKLGRVSNMPTIWTNSLAGALLAGGAVGEGPFWCLMLAMTLMYIGGMYLNDAFDAEIDAQERPERAIPSGRVARSTVFVLGFGMLVAAVALLAKFNMAAGIGAPALAGCIVPYDWYHKTNPLSPVVMGACRALVYMTAAFCFTTEPGGAVKIGAVLLLCYLIGLTYVAKQENLGE